MDANTGRSFPRNTGLATGQGRDLRRLRMALDLRQIDIADYLGVSQRTVSAYECGKHVIPQDVWDSLAELAEEVAAESAA